ncbi:MAG: DcaP family trimeric outer membrane transporter [Pseudoxanthomonas suwonensis]|nr:DcaP family trimeric outer membrane transporter [Pseudoxanthomonas suwonensis]
MALATALLPMTASAQSAREAELEARIAQLEQTVAELVAAQRAGAASPMPAPAPATPATPPAAPPPAPAVAQATPIVPGAPAGTRFSVGGMIKYDAMYTDTTDGEIAEGSTGRLFYLPGAIPVGSAGEPNGDFNSSARFSRLWLSIDSQTDAGNTLKAFFEADFFGGGGSALGNEVATNTHGLTLRHAYVQWNNWLAGQTWSNFQDVGVLPDSVDFIGPSEGTVFARQAQVRYSNGPWTVSIENPESVITPLHGNGTRIVSDDNAVPDVTARWTHRGDRGHFSAAGLVRQLRQETPTSQAQGIGAGVSLSGKHNIGASDDIRWMLTGGRGISRYVGFALGTDGVIDQGGDIDATGMLAGFVAWRHVFNQQLRGNLFYSRAEYDNDVALTGPGITRSAQSIHANLIYSPLPKLDVGAELIFGRRTIESGESGDLRRLHTHIRYSF